MLLLCTEQCVKSFKPRAASCVCVTVKKTDWLVGLDGAVVKRGTVSTLVIVTLSLRKLNQHRGFY